MTGKQSFGFYFTVDLSVTIVVIACVVSMILSTINESRKVVETTAATAEVMGIYRAPLSTYYALHGAWPKDNEELQEMFPGPAWKPVFSMAGNVRILDGAITFDMLRRLSGKSITLHPAVPAQDPLGPVKWVAGPKSLSRDWAMAGVDHTTVDDDHIFRILKQ